MKKKNKTLLTIAIASVVGYLIYRRREKQTQDPLGKNYTQVATDNMPVVKPSWPIDTIDTGYWESRLFGENKDPLYYSRDY